MNDAILEQLAAVIEARRGGDPDASYVARLLQRGEDAILKKIGEEATEAVMAGKDGSPERIIAETADLWFHCLIMPGGIRPARRHLRAGGKGRPQGAGSRAKRVMGLRGRSEQADVPAADRPTRCSARPEPVLREMRERAACDDVQGMGQ